MKSDTFPRWNRIISEPLFKCLQGFFFLLRSGSFTQESSESRKWGEERKWTKRGAGCDLKASVYGNDLYSCVLIMSFYHIICFSPRSPLHSFPFCSSSCDYTICFIYYSDKAVQRADLFFSVQVPKLSLGKKGFYSWSQNGQHGTTVGENILL